MTSILISSDALELSGRVAEGVAETLGVTLIDRDILPEISKQHEISQAHLLSLLDFNGRFGLLEKRALMCLEASVTDRIRDDNIVCTGLGAHLYVRGISHLLNIRVLSDISSMTYRMAAEKNISPKKVRRILENRMKKRRDWTLNAFGVDETHPANYDMLFTLGKFTVERIVKTIVETAGDRKFAAMTYSRKCLEDQVLASRVRLALVGKYADVGVKAEDGTVRLYLSKGWGWKRKADAVKQIAAQVEGANYVRVQLASRDSEESVAKEAGAA
jgi:cytidylate kinase